MHIHFPFLVIRGFVKSVLIVLGLSIFFTACSDDKDGKAENEPEITFSSAQEALPYMMRGINLGNTLEPETEGGWNNGPVQQHYFDDYKSAGFTCVRVPVKWGSHTLETPPFTVDPQWMTRVEEIIDWGLERNLFIILNAHHEDWLKQDYSELNKARFDSIWSQISTQFKNKSDRLLFEVINEPFGMTVEQVNDLNLRLIPLIREDNPTRILIFSGNEWSGLEQLMAATIPEDDNLMGYFHSYDPWSFAGEGEGTWGTAADQNGIVSMFEQAADWSNAHSIPVMVSEFGAVHACDYNSRMHHYFTYVESAIKNNVAFQVWDDGGNFGVYERNTRTWPEVKDILMYAHPDGPTDLNLEIISLAIVKLTWTNRSEAYQEIIIERRDGDGPFTRLAELASDVVQYTDSGLSGDVTYDYRVLAKMSDDLVYHSYPLRLAPEPLQEVRAPYHGSPISIPGVIQAEDFDRGGEGDAYHDSDAANIPNAYRSGEGVDIEARHAGGYQISYLAAGEWLEYTIQVATPRVYTITTNLASMNGGATFKFSADDAFSPEITVPATNSWQTLTSVSTTMPILAGEQILRFSVISQGDFNVDSFIIE